MAICLSPCTLEQVVPPLSCVVSCETCSRDFSSLVFLDHHLLTSRHNTVTPFRCALCTKRFITQLDAHNHFTAHHKPEEQAASRNHHNPFRNSALTSGRRLFPNNSSSGPLGNDSLSGSSLQRMISPISSSNNDHGPELQHKLQSLFNIIHCENVIGKRPSEPKQNPSPAINLKISSMSNPLVPQWPHNSDALPFRGPDRAMLVEQADMEKHLESDWDTEPDNQDSDKFPSVLPRETSPKTDHAPDDVDVHIKSEIIVSKMKPDDVDDSKGDVNENTKPEAKMEINSELEWLTANSEVHNFGGGVADLAQEDSREPKRNHRYNTRSARSRAYSLISEGLAVLEAIHSPAKDAAPSHSDPPGQELEPQSSKSKKKKKKVLGKRKSGTKKISSTKSTPAPTATTTRGMGTQSGSEDTPELKPFTKRRRLTRASLKELQKELKEKELKEKELREKELKERELKEKEMKEKELKEKEMMEKEIKVEAQTLAEKDVKAHPTADLEMAFVWDGEKKIWPCPKCDKVCKRKAHLKSHLQVHSDERPYECRYCGAGFAFQSGMRRHEKAHTGENIVHCETCNKPFRRQYLLNMHLKQGKCDGAD